MATLYNKSKFPLTLFLDAPGASHDAVVRISPQGSATIADDVYDANLSAILELVQRGILSQAPLTPGATPSPVPPPPAAGGGGTTLGSLQGIQGVTGLPGPQGVTGPAGSGGGGGGSQGVTGIQGVTGPAGGGGGGGSIQILTTDPAAPNEGEQWFLYNAGSAITGYNLVSPPGAPPGAEQEIITFLTIDPNVLNTIFGPKLDAVLSASLPGSMTVQLLTAQPDGLHINYDPNLTLSQFNTAFLTAAAAALPGVNITAVVGPAGNPVGLIGGGQFIIQAVPNGTAGSVHFKIHQGGQNWAVQLI